MPNGFNLLQRSPLTKTNALAATQGQPQAGQPSGKFSVDQHVQNNWDQANQQHKQLMEGATRLDKVRRELDSLMKLGDSVTVEEVIKGAGALVGAGFSPMSTAQLLSSMPTTGGEALQAWVEQQDQQVRGMEAQMRQRIEASSVHRGMTGLASLHVQHIKDTMSPPGPQGGGLAIPPSMQAAAAQTPPGASQEESDEGEG